MTWPFENDTSAITKKLANKSLKSEKRRNLMVVIAVALAAFLICFTGIVSTSLTQMQRNQVVDTYEAVWMGVEENDIETLKGVPEFERVGGYYMLGEELSEQGYHASYVYCDAQMMEITKAQMELLEGRVPVVLAALIIIIMEILAPYVIYIFAGKGFEPAILPMRLQKFLSYAKPRKPSVMPP